MCAEEPSLFPTWTADDNVVDLAAELRSRGISGVDGSTLAKAMYAGDASLYRVVPEVVVRPRHTDELLAVQAASRELRIPLTMRGAGTSIAGNAVGPGIVVDTRDLRRIVAIDPEARTATVQPGVVHADLQRAAAPYALRFGPDPSTHTRCTIGGMIGNNACGSRALGYGRTVDNVEAMTVLFGNGERATFAGGFGGAETHASTTGDRLLRLARENLAHLRTEFGRFKRQVSGYSLEHLLPEKGGRVDRFLVGSEGTLATVLEATVRLVQDEPGRLLLVLGYPTMADAADAVPALLAAAPRRLIACEGIDARIVELVRGTGKPVPDLPMGAGWLMVEVAGADAVDLADRLAALSGALEHRLVANAGEAAALWRIREDGAGLAGVSLPTPAHSGWEDAAVPPEHLGAWLREFEEILGSFGLHGYPYGHFGDGCIHCRIDLPFAAGRPESARVFRDFVTQCATTMKKFGGSLTGEHGDGRVRSELLPTMYDPTSIELFEQVKAVCDPDDLLNPGVLVRPVSITDDLRPVRARTQEPQRTALRLLDDDGDFGAAVHRCTGVGRCVAPETTSVMCPSYLATREEKDSTRGRARVLQEALDGTLVHGLADPVVGEALDLCLACKGCASDCPTGIDMATYKSEAIYRAYRGRRRPRSHYLLGRLPKWARLIAPVASAANAAMRLGPVAKLAKKTAGIDQRRPVPVFATNTLRRSTAPRRARRSSVETPDVWVWADSFTDHFFPHSGLAAIRFLEAQGLTVRVIADDACCGLTWITTGQIDQARRIMDRTVRTLAPYVASGVPVIGLEPSCLATMRSDSLEITDTREAKTVADGIFTFAELVTQLVGKGRVALPALAGVDVVAQPHCHQSAVLGWAADQRLLEQAGATVTKVAGCCGLAGNFGVEEGHYEVSVAIAETNLLPALREHPDAVVLADGMSCRVQLDDLAQVPTMHLAELFDSRLRPSADLVGRGGGSLG